ncbi:cysteine hydrolase family protein [Bacillus sp. KH172YL63]|uniref:cysteine hydrolase family protein n=1 Tax=Bacillus sp. KH172YL63 TaxID=2709784 RepID=UPI001564AA85|nr:cysteine hydrolase family protein [Bacillus sp. KH172YL63]
MGKKALVLVDVQEAFKDSKWGERNNPDAELNIQRILHLWREKGYEVIYIQHESDQPSSLFYPGNKGYELNPLVTPKEKEVIFSKKVNSSFIGTGLESYLKENGICELVITGLTTPHCVSTTARMSGNLGFTTYLISDATAAFGLTDHKGVYHRPEVIHEITLATLHDEFATILTTDEMMKEFDLV